MATTPQPVDEFKKRVRHYADILNDLFDPTPHMDVIRLFEFVCALVRAGGMSGPGWDPWVESQALLDDLKALMSSAHKADGILDPQRTEMRLALLSYCHITEADLSYFLIVNLLRLRLGHKYDMEPFADLVRPIKRKGVTVDYRPPSPSGKIKKITELSQQAKMPLIGDALAEIYDPVPRNAVYHSDYVLHGNAMHLRKASRLSKKHKHYTQVIEFDELQELINNAFAFYSALFSLYNRCRKSFTDFKGKILPYDQHYKGLLEFLFDKDDALIGFRVYWPNNSYSEYCRAEDISTGVNIHFDPDRSINLFVGIIASQPGRFSPLVEHDAQPTYPTKPGTDKSPYWPTVLAGYNFLRLTPLIR